MRGRARVQQLELRHRVAHREPVRGLPARAGHGQRLQERTRRRRADAAARPDELHREAERSPGGAALPSGHEAACRCAAERRRGLCVRPAKRRFPGRVAADPDPGGGRPDHERRSRGPNGRRLARVAARGEDERPQQPREPPRAGRVQMDAVGVEPVLSLAGGVPVGDHDLRPLCSLGPDAGIDVAVVVTCGGTADGQWITILARNGSGPAIVGSNAGI